MARLGHADVIETASDNDLASFSVSGAGDAPTRIEVRMGVGDGTFGASVEIVSFPDTDYGKRFGLPQRLCVRFPGVK